MSHNPEAPVKYFGYGANASPEMMEAIVGRVPEGQKSTLFNHVLLIQQAHEIPAHVREILSGKWSVDELDVFRTYAIRRQVEREVPGTLWKLSPLERELVDNWEMNDGLWFQKTNVPVLADGGMTIASTEVIEDADLTPANILEPKAPTFLNAVERMLEVASAVREEYLQKQQKDNQN